MRVLVLYATTEGQTRKIARFCADRLADRGFGAELLAAAEADDLDLARFDAAILGASVHLGHYQADLRGVATEQAKALNAMPTLFLSVSLAAAGTEKDDWVGLADIVARFAAETGWQPGEVVHVAGAFRFVQYDWLKSLAMRWIASQRGQSVNPHEDREYTDWDALGETLDRFAAGLESRG